MPRLGTPRWPALAFGLHWLASVLALTASLAATAAPAKAEQPLITSQAIAANARFLAYAPPPPGGAGAMCLVDSGLDLNPDTQPNVVERLALDGGDPGDVHPTKHGTRMAMVAGGQTNGWGGVGVWPHLKIVSVRAMAPETTAFGFGEYSRAVNRCTARATARRISVINLSLGAAAPSLSEIAALTNRLGEARDAGINVASAGGNGGQALDYPAAISGAFAIGAHDASGMFCSFSARGAGLDLSAPGCGMHVARADGTPAWANGTSEAAAFTSAVLVALRSYKPALGPADAEHLLVDRARVTSAGRVLNVEAAFDAAGLRSIVESGNAAADAAVSRAGSNNAVTGGGNRAGMLRGDAAADVGADTPPDRQLPRPRLRAVYRQRARLTLRLANRPANATVEIRVLYRRRSGEFRRRSRTLRRVTSSFSLRLARWSALAITYRSRHLLSSTPLVIKKRSLRPNVQLRRRVPRS